MATPPRPPSGGRGFAWPTQAPVPNSLQLGTQTGNVRQSRSRSRPESLRFKELGLWSQECRDVRNPEFLIYAYRKTKKTERRKTRWSEGATSVEQTTPSPRDPRQMCRPLTGSPGQCALPLGCRWPCLGLKGSVGWEAYQGPQGP
jgi:hypothetical protein